MGGEGKEGTHVVAGSGDRFDPNLGTSELMIASPSAPQQVTAAAWLDTLEGERVYPWPSSATMGMQHVVWAWQLVCAAGE